jgi:hypothetical protein
MEFEITPSSSPVKLIFGAIVAFMLLLTLLFAWIASSASSLSVTLEGDSIRLKVPIYGRTIPLSALDLAASEVTNIDKDSPVRPTMRTNGIGLPGYGVGWFRLKNGRKALAALTSRERVVYLPTREGYVLLLSLQDADGFLSALRSSGGS